MIKINHTGRVLALKRGLKHYLFRYEETIAYTYGGAYGCNGSERIDFRQIHPQTQRASRGGSDHAYGILSESEGKYDQGRQAPVEKDRLRCAAVERNQD